jgi:hypothetical protein
MTGLQIAIALWLGVWLPLALVFIAKECAEGEWVKLRNDRDMFQTQADKLKGGIREEIRLREFGNKERNDRLNWLSELCREVLAIKDSEEKAKIMDAVVEATRSSDYVRLERIKSAVLKRLNEQKAGK